METIKGKVEKILKEYFERFIQVEISHGNYADGKCKEKGCLGPDIYIGMAEEKISQLLTTEIDERLSKLKEDAKMLYIYELDMMGRPQIFRSNTTATFGYDYDRDRHNKRVDGFIERIEKMKGEK